MKNAEFDGVSKFVETSSKTFPQKVVRKELSEF
jgi:hypothetical protein